MNFPQIVYSNDEMYQEFLGMMKGHMILEVTAEKTIRTLNEHINPSWAFQGMWKCSLKKVFKNYNLKKNCLVILQPKNKNTEPLRLRIFSFISKLNNCEKTYFYEYNYIILEKLQCLNDKCELCMFFPYTSFHYCLKNRILFLLFIIYLFISAWIYLIHLMNEFEEYYLLYHSCFFCIFIFTFLSESIGVLKTHI